MTKKLQCKATLRIDRNSGIFCCGLKEGHKENHFVDLTDFQLIWTNRGSRQ